MAGGACTGRRASAVPELCEGLHPRGRVPYPVPGARGTPRGRGEVSAVTEDCAGEPAHRAHQQEVAAELGRQALVERDLASLMRSEVEGVAGTLCVERAEVFELAPSGDVLVLRAAAGWDDPQLGRVSLPTAPTSPAGYTVESQAPVVVEDLGREAEFCVPRLLADLGTVALLNVVILSRATGGSVDRRPSSVCPRSGIP